MSDVLPPPPPRRADDGCWKWGAIGCVGCGFLVVLGVIALVVILRPYISEALKGMEKGQLVARDMRGLNDRLRQYDKAKGKYPAKLKDLVPNFVSEERGLHPSADPSGPEFTYFPPA